MKTPEQDLETLSDNALMLKVKDGNLDTLGLLFERYKKPLFGFFYNSGQYKIVIDEWKKGDINGGGAEITMKTNNGDVYIRKKG